MAVGAAGAAGVALSSRHGRLIEAALSSDQGPAGSLSDIEHVVILMQENRSFDHYFGTLSVVKGFSDPLVPTQTVGARRYSAFDQWGPPGYEVGGEPYLQPFELVSNFPSADGQTTNDITHDWGPQHLAWNSGAMDQFLKVHLASDGSANGFLTMGYFTRGDLPFYHALADAFTVCDGYFSSVIGPTYPNRLMLMTGSLGADGSQGGPVLETYSDPVQYYGTMNWLTMPEVLSQAGVSWKVYQDPTSTILFNVLPFFKSYTSPSTSLEREASANGLGPQYPAEFVADVAAGTLPAVSWLIPPAACCEHPAAPPEYGEWLVSEILSTLVSNPDVWARTVFLVVYDENGGFFDHVPPPTPGPIALSKSEIPAGDEFVGEYVTAPLPSSGYYSAGGQQLSVYGPVGLGFRTPCLVLSPFSRGGYVCSETFDHVSVLKFVAERFGVPVPNASKWRLETVGDLTGALALAVPADPSVPSLPGTSLADPDVATQAVVNAVLGTEAEAPIEYPPPTQNAGVPQQETSPRRTRLPLPPPSGPAPRPGTGTAGGASEPRRSAQPAASPGQASGRHAGPDAANPPAAMADATPLRLADRTSGATGEAGLIASVAAGVTGGSLASRRWRRWLLRRVAQVKPAHTASGESAAASVVGPPVP